MAKLTLTMDALAKAERFIRGQVFIVNVALVFQGCPKQ
jgi:hypothetical protein